jgi:hypothetical protein
MSFHRRTNMRMNIFSRLDPDIMYTHILSRLDGTTLTALSLVSSELRHLICNNTEDLWRNICTSTWPSLLLDPIVDSTISTFPGGYRSFFSDAAFPSLHHHKYPHCSSPSTIDLIHVVDVFVKGKPLYSRVILERYNKIPKFDVKSDDSNLGHIHFRVKAESSEYLQENLRLSWVVIDPTRKRAANLFCSSVKPLSVRPLSYHYNYDVVYGMEMVGERTTEMINFEVTVPCFFKGDWFQVRGVNVSRICKDGLKRNAWWHQFY